jgi:hypothetical protein
MEVVSFMLCSIKKNGYNAEIQQFNNNKSSHYRFLILQIVSTYFTYYVGFPM